ncbi:hypothetical protein ACFFIX_25905 [Metabacillus herbersteinensis]|uniref:Protein translocase subunit SecDF P1 domain-containing protein n=1 Tax=Metabacillus herbersteinensis TaxID=283816 RepID=A0ABV6GM51_9BACI
MNVLGVSEPNIQIEGENRIRVQLAGVENQNQAREVLSTEANLSFRDANDRLLIDGSDLVEGGADAYGYSGYYRFVICCILYYSVLQHHSA